MIDVDHFKSTNDRWGHEAGDRVLVALADALMQAFSSSGRAFRLGGEEFCLLLNGLDALETEQFVSVLRKDLDGMPMLPDGSPLAFSAGIVEAKAEESSLEQLLAQADAALYRAKRNGRGRSEIAFLNAA